MVLLDKLEVSQATSTCIAVKKQNDDKLPTHIYQLLINPTIGKLFNRTYIKL